MWTQKSGLPNTSSLKKRIRLALQEDIGAGDITSLCTIPPTHFAKAFLKAKAKGVLAGLHIAALVMKSVDASVSFRQKALEGGKVSKGQVIAELQGKIASILKAERLMLNLLQHLSGIATLTAKYVEATKGTRTTILDTRKTLPLWRDLQKYAVRVGGGQNHRMGLYHAFLIKENHIAAAGGITQAVALVKRQKKWKKKARFLEVETKTLAQVRQAYQAGVDRIMLDNMPVPTMKKAVAWLRRQPKPIPKTEASGNVDLTNLRIIAQTGVDHISVGKLTHSPGILDMSLLIKP